MPAKNEKADQIAKTLHSSYVFLKESKLLSRIITPIGGFLGGPGGAIAGAAAGVGLNKAGYGCRPRGKHPQYGCGAGHSQVSAGILIPKGLPMRAKPIYRPQSGGNSPFMLTTNSSFNSIKLR